MARNRYSNSDGERKPPMIEINSFTLHFRANGITRGASTFCFRFNINVRNIVQRIELLGLNTARENCGYT